VLLWLPLERWCRICFRSLIVSRTSQLLCKQLPGSVQPPRGGRCWTASAGTLRRRSQLRAVHLRHTGESALSPCAREGFSVPVRTYTTVSFASIILYFSFLTRSCTRSWKRSWRPSIAGRQPYCLAAALMQMQLFLR